MSFLCPYILSCILLDSFRDVVGFGSVAFIRRLNGVSGCVHRETEARGRLRNRVSFSEVVAAVVAVREEPSGEWLHRQGDGGKWLVLKGARACTGMTLGELGASIGGKDYAAVCMGLRRFEHRLKTKRTNKELNQIYGRGREILYIQMLSLILCGGS